MTTDSWAGDDETTNENMFKWWHTGSVTRSSKMKPSNNIIHIPNHVFEYRIVSFAGGEWWHVHNDAKEELLATLLLAGVKLCTPPIYVSTTFEKTLLVPGVPMSPMKAVGILYKHGDLEIHLDAYEEFMNCKFKRRG